MYPVNVLGCVLLLVSQARHAISFVWSRSTARQHSILSSVLQLLSVLHAQDHVATARYCKEHDTGHMWADLFRVVDAASHLGLGNELAAFDAAEVGCTPYQRV